MNLQVKFDADGRLTTPPSDQPPPIVTRARTFLWARKWLIASIAAIVMAADAFVVLLMPPVYTSQAMLELNFTREESGPTATSSRQLAPMDARALVNGAAQEISSRANASRVVSRLGLDADPKLESRSALAELVASARRTFGVDTIPLPAHELAVDEVQHSLAVSYNTLVYVIGTSYTDRDPLKAARVANALVTEHLRGERLKELAEKRGAASRELAVLSEKFGVLHPTYIEARTRIENLEAEIKAIDQSEADPGKLLLAGQYLTLAEPIMAPTGPIRSVLLALGLCASLILGILAALLAEWMGSLSRWRTVPWESRQV